MTKTGTQMIFANMHWPLNKHQALNKQKRKQKLRMMVYLIKTSFQQHTTIFRYYVHWMKCKWRLCIRGTKKDIGQLAKLRFRPRVCSVCPETTAYLQHPLTEKDKPEHSRDIPNFFQSSTLDTQIYLETLCTKTCMLISGKGCHSKTFFHALNKL